MKLLAPVLLLSAFSSLTLTEVVEKSNQWKLRCHDFFIQNPKNQKDIFTPTILKGRQYKKICQLWNEKYRFATLYDTERRIPVYSAYTFLQKQNTTRTRFWKIEPQLENIRSSPEMKDSPIKPGNIMHQAVNSDYTGSGFTRGHVFPRLFAGDQDQADSSFTLTNVAPQRERSNQQWAKRAEEPMRKYITDNCRLDQNHRAYIVTGVVPDQNNWLNMTRNDRYYGKGINIPSHFWSAFHCTGTNRLIMSGAFIAEQEKFRLEQLTISELNTKLTRLYRQDFRVFPGSQFENLRPAF